MTAPPPHRILVVDDDDANRYFKAHVLSKRGYAVCEAALAGEALRLVEAEQPAVVVLDVKLPDGNGIELGATIKTKQPGTIVLQTSAAYTSDEHRVAGLVAGADAYLVEPIEPEELLATVESLLRLHRAEQELRALNQRLEQRVAERTRDLVEAHQRLAAENEERRRVEEILRHAEKLDTIGQLTGGVAHDFNNFLTIVLGNLQLIEREVGRAPQASLERIGSLVAGARRGAEDCERLTRQLLAFARRDIPRVEVVSPNDIIRRFEGILRRAVGEHIELVLAPAAKGHFATDVGQFEAALLNLAVNARDAMPGGGELCLKTEDVEIGPGEMFRAARSMFATPIVGPGRYVRIAVTDTGTGMAKDVLAHAFEPFFTTKGVGQGSGLGLSQVYGFVRQTSGFLTVDSAVDVGTTVTLYLPRTDAAPSAVVAAPAAEEPLRGSETILIVEDNAMVLELASAVMAELGYRVLTAGTARAALDIIATEEPIALLFTDIILPHGMSGVELAREARRLRPALPVLMTTGYAGASGPPADGEFPILAKPYRPAELAHRIRGALAAG